jgi:hypothetical protein
MMEAEVECPDSYVNDATFIQAVVTIRGRDAVKEFIA